MFYCGFALPLWRTYFSFWSRMHIKYLFFLFFFPLTDAIFVLPSELIAPVVVTFLVWQLSVCWGCPITEGKRAISYSVQESTACGLNAVCPLMWPEQFLTTCGIAACDSLSMAVSDSGTPLSLMDRILILWISKHYEEEDWQNCEVSHIAHKLKWK